MQKKDDKVGNKTANREKGKRKKRKRERKIERDSPKKKQVQILACAHALKTDLFNYVRSVGKYAFLSAKLIFSHSYAD